MLKVLICGPRDWVDQKPIEDVMRLLPKDTVVVHGGQTGVDNISGYVAKILGLRVRSYPVNHKLDGPWPGAGPRRNLRMLNAESPFEDGSFVDLGFAFKCQEALTRGTGGMAAMMKQRNLPVWEVLYQKRNWESYFETLKVALQL